VTRPVSIADGFFFGGMGVARGCLIGSALIDALIDRWARQPSQNAKAM
jgi:hypothetical protein